MSTHYKNWAVVYNPSKPATEAVAGQLEGILKKLGATNVKIYDGAPDSLTGYQAAAAIGGDGTMLGCVKAAVEADTALVGVNLGKLGYLTAISKDEMEAEFAKILSGGYKESARNVIELNLPDGRKMWALNDVVIKASDFRLADIRVFLGDELVTVYSCDGLIFSTPTGSTAYNLSAGGPLLHGHSNAMVMTPICAHTLTNRSVVFGPKCKIRVEHAENPSPVRVSVDGRMVTEGISPLPLEVHEAPKKLKILEDAAQGSFALLRQKLGWR